MGESELAMTSRDPLSPREIPRTKRDLVRRLVSELVALPWTKVGPYRMPKEPVETWAITFSELPELAVYCSTAEECEREWRDALTSYLMAHITCGELPPRFPPSWTFAQTANSGSWNLIGEPFRGGSDA